MSLKVTSIEELKKISEGEIIELSPFVGNTPFVVRVKRMSILGLVSKGKIPNMLLATANEMFNGKSKDRQTKPEDIKNMADVMNIVISECLLEPTLEQLKDNNIDLTDIQQIELFNYTQQGVNALNSFHKQQGNTESDIKE